MAARVSAAFLPPQNYHQSPPPAHMLADLLRERAAIEPIRRSVPHLWHLLDLEIARLGARASDPLPTTSPSAHSSLSAALIRPHAALYNPAKRPSLPSDAHLQPTSPVLRKRVKLPVPADKHPEYNFVGRLLGPRGTTLKTLERDTGCKIMIRGKGSIRKDKEPDVRGKPGWEHVFNEALHVVIEVGDALDDTAATLALQRAKEAVEVLLVPVPEERDALKRQQLRALAIMNGTYRGGNPTRGTDSGLSTLTAFASSPPASQSLHPRCVGIDSHNVPLYLGDTVASPPMYPPSMSSFEPLPQDDHPLLRSTDYARYDNPTYHRKPVAIPKASGGLTPSSGGTTPQTRSYENGVVVGDMSDLSAKMQHCAVDEFASSSVGDDSPESSRNSDDGEPSTHMAGAVYTGGKVKVPNGPPGNRADTSVGFGGFLGQEFYNGAFSNGPSPNPWDQPPAVASSPQFSSGLYGFSPIPSPQVLTTTASLVTPTDRHDGY